MAAVNRRLRDASALIAPAVAETIDTLALGEVDAGAVRLAKRYAAQIDEAAAIAADLAQIPYDESLHKRVAALSRRVEAQEVLRTLGPLLLGVLESLGATPRARAAVGTGGGAKGGPTRLERAREAYGA